MQHLLPDVKCKLIGPARSGIWTSTKLNLDQHEIEFGPQRKVEFEPQHEIDFVQPVTLP